MAKRPTFSVQGLEVMNRIKNHAPDGFSKLRPPQGGTMQSHSEPWRSQTNQAGLCSHHPGLQRNGAKFASSEFFPILILVALQLVQNSRYVVGN